MSVPCPVTLARSVFETAPKPPESAVQIPPDTVARTPMAIKTASRPPKKVRTPGHADAVVAALGGLAEASGDTVVAPLLLRSTCGRTGTCCSCDVKPPVPVSHSRRSVKSRRRLPAHTAAARPLSGKLVPVAVVISL
jgi:hypothetical protein